MSSQFGSFEKKCCLKSTACVEGAVYCVSCRCGQQYYLCPNHCDKVVKEALQSHSKLLSRKGDTSRTPLERICNIGHKNLNQILMLMANSTSAFRTTECSGRLLVSEKLHTNCKMLKPKSAVSKSSLSEGEAVPVSPNSLPAPTGESHPNFKTAMCRYGDRCIYGERCSFAHNGTELRIPSYAAGSTYAVMDPDAAVVPTVSMGAGGASVALVSPVIRPSANEVFVMQNDDFPGLPGSYKAATVAPTRAAATNMAGINSIRASNHDSRSQLSTFPPSQAPTLAPIQSSFRVAAPALAIQPVDPRAPTLNSFGFTQFQFGRSDTSVAHPSAALSSPELLCQSQPSSRMFEPDHTTSFASLDSHSKIQHQDAFHNQDVLNFESDIMSSRDIGGSMFSVNANSSLLGSDFFGEFSTMASTSNFSASNSLIAEIIPSKQPALVKSNVFITSETMQGSRLDKYAGHPQLSLAGSAPPGFNNMQSHLPAPPKYLQQQQIQQHQMQQQLPPKEVAPGIQPTTISASGIDADLVPIDTFSTVDWLRNSDMGIFRWSGNDRAWTEFAMHVPSNFHGFFTSNLPTWLQHSNCVMWFDKDQLRGEASNFLVFRRGENGDESNQAMQRALELISHHLSFILVKNEAVSRPAHGPLLW